MFEYSFSLGNILTILTFIIGGIAFAYTIKADTRILDYKYSIIDKRLEYFAEELAKLAEVITNQALQDNRITVMENRMLAEGKRIDLLSERVSKIYDK